MFLKQFFKKLLYLVNSNVRGIRYSFTKIKYSLVQESSVFIFKTKIELLILDYLKKTRRSRAYPCCLILTFFYEKHYCSCRFLPTV